jgi:transcriptional regulator with XRE-family HTH domain
MALRAKKPVSAAYPKELKTLGDHLKKRRLDLKMLQKEVAEKLNTTVCTYRNWEKNWRNPSIINIPKIIEFLDYIPWDISCNSLGEKIIAYRKLSGLSQKDLAS